MALSFFVALLVGSIGCATMARNKERELAAAGFQMKLADTPAKATHLASLQQRKLIPTQKTGRLVYVYADSKGCNCLYVGSEADYQRYQRMVMVKREIDEQRATAEEMDDASMQWGTWGEWNRPIY
jgi:hypothetical protein